MQHFPFIGPNRALLCCDRSVFIGVNGSFHAALRPCDVSGLSVIEMLLIVQSVCPVCSMLTFFQNRLRSQLPAVTGNGFFSPCIVDGMLSFVCGCVWGQMRACVSQEHLCDHVLGLTYCIVYLPKCTRNCAISGCNWRPPGSGAVNIV